MGSNFGVGRLLLDVVGQKYTSTIGESDFDANVFAL